MSQLRRSFIVVWSVLAAVAVSAQQAVPNTARLSGVVVGAGAAPQPVRRAIVTIGGEGARGQSAVTDDQGRFAIGGLPAGRFTLTASKPAHLTAAYGAKSPGGPGTPILLGTGETISNLAIVLPRGAAISGVVRDRSGEAASTVQVTVIQIDAPNALTGAAPRPEPILTDDRGMFRAFGLKPGTYVVAAVPLLGLSGELSAMTSDAVDAAMREQQSLGGRGATGTAGAGQPPPAATAPPPKPRAYGYVPIFFPGTPVAAEATRITLRAGEERNDVDLTLDLIPVSTIQGVVQNPGGPLPEMDLRLATDAPEMPFVFGGTPSLTGRPGVNGNNTFTYTFVPPGHYWLSAQSSNTQTRVSADGSSSSTTRLAPGTTPMLWALTEVDVSGNDVSGVSLQLQPGMTFSGRVMFNATTLPPPQNLTQVRVTLTLTGPPGSNVIGGGYFGLTTQGTAATASPRADGTFEVTGLVPGRYTLTSSVPGVSGPAGWWLRSAVIGGRDVLDTPLDINAGSNLADAVLTFSDRHAELVGALQTGAGQAATDYFVIVCPADPALWRTGSRRIRSARPATDGQFSFADIPPGDYVLAASTDLADDWPRASFLAEIVKGGVAVTIGEGEKKTQNLKISGG
jgi:hypothetical protein